MCAGYMCIAVAFVIFESQCRQRDDYEMETTCWSTYFAWHCGACVRFEIRVKGVCYE